MNFFRSIRKTPSGLDGRLACLAAALVLWPWVANADLVHQWTFNDGTARDSVGTVHGNRHRGALIQDGKLLLNGVDQCVITAPLTETLTQRTLVAWVALSNLTQRGGTVLTVAVAGQSTVFDGLGYASTQPNRWENASENGHRSPVRTPSAGFPETSTSTVMLAVVYGDEHPDGIKLYRNDALYAEYRPNQPAVTYVKGQSHVLMGVPHHALLGQASRADGAGPALAGAIDEARIYNRALSAMEVGELFRAGPVPTAPALWRTAKFQAGVALGLFLLAGVAIRSLESRKYRQRLRLLEQQNALSAERARIAKDMHDELGANLTRIKLLSELIERESSAPDQTARHARHISRTARELAQGMDEIVWAVNPKKDRLDNLVFYVGAFVEELLGVTHLRYRLHLPDEAPDLTLPAEVRHHVFLAMKEALHNVVKHSQATEVQVRLRLMGRQLEIQVEDDGIGFEPDSADSKRNGLANMRQRLARIAGTCTIESRPGAGTKVKLTVPARTVPGDSHV